MFWPKTLCWALRETDMPQSIRVLVATSGRSQLPVTLAPVDLLLSSVLLRTCTHIPQFL